MSKTSVTNNLPPSFGQPPSDPQVPPRRNRNESVLLTGAKAVASLRFTVALFTFSILLVFFGTLAQIDEGIWTVVSKYFRSFYVWVPFQLFFPRTLTVWGGFPFPGGLTLGSLLMLNLLAAHALRFKFQLKRTGVILLHAGLIVMMLGELITGQFAVEGTMTIENKTSCNFVEERGNTELAFVQHLDKKTDDVVTVSGKTLARHREGDRIRSDDLPVDVQVNRYYVNSATPISATPDARNPATAGDGLKWQAVEKREGTGVDAEQRIDMASAYVTFLKKGTDDKIGTYLVSLWFSAVTDQPQQLEVDGKKYDVYLRFKRTYKPYTVTLNKFTHEVYEGTTTPKNFASTIELTDPSRGTELDTTISMNNPLRYNGETFYQSSFLPRDQGTVLQVVRNPAWTMPYISCVMVALGMIIHFSITLVGFLRKLQLQRISAFGTATDYSMPSLVVPGVVVGVAALFVLMAMAPPQDPPNGMRLHDFAKLPVVSGGRTKPIQSDAMNDLQMVSNRRTFVTKDKVSHDAMKWYLDVMTSRITKDREAEEYEVFRIDNDQVLNLLELPNKPEFYRYSIREMAPKFDVLEKEVSRAEEVEEDKRTLFDTKILELAKRIQIYMDLAKLQSPNLIPALDGKESRPLGDGIRDLMGGADDADALALFKMLSAYSSNDTKTFNKELDAYHARLEQTIPTKVKKAEFEVFFNDFEPFYLCSVLYVLVWILGVCSWVGFKTPLARAAFWLCMLTLVVHTFAIGARMYIQGRPPITNLYSTAIFISWATVGLGLILEAIFRNGFGVVVSGVTGFLGVIIAHNLSTDGDTMQMMQAVLDTNFWLATHVVVINFGYAATFVTGFMGMLFILAALVQYVSKGALDRDVFPIIGRMLYGILCFATLCSFVGTVLGGIWADQSWGRFWGWDPKENGALMIVIMNALILHARWGGLVQQRGIAVLSLFGNILTGWSWFGVNLLGVGLHSYGFMQGTFWWLMFFIATQVVLIVLGMMPFLDYWRTAGAQKAKLPGAMARTSAPQPGRAAPVGAVSRRKRR